MRLIRKFHTYFMPEIFLKPLFSTLFKSVGLLDISLVFGRYFIAISMENSYFYYRPELEFYNNSIWW